MTFKTIALAAVATTAFASVAAADAFTFNESEIRSTTVELGQVNSSGDGVISLYAYHGDEQGALLGTEDVTAGANFDVRVTLDRPAYTDVLAVLTVDGQIIDTQEIDSAR